MKHYSLPELADIATEIRVSIIQMLARAKSGHSGGALGMADVFTALYFGDVLKHDPASAEWEDRDRVLLSNGHICPVLYATLAKAGYFDPTLLETLRLLHSPLQGHPHRGSLPGIENTSGPLALGLSQAAGLAHAFKLDNKDNRVYCFTSDGEHQEGQTWEAYMYAAKYTLSNLTLLVDRNNIQIDGNTEDIMPLEPFTAKLGSFGWHVLTVDGHNIEAIIDAINFTKSIHDQPSVIVCHTTPGKGVSFMENKFEWHGKAPTEEQAAQALGQLKAIW